MCSSYHFTLTAHQLEAYSQWTLEAFGRPDGPYAKQTTPETIRQSDAYRVVTPEQAIEIAQGLGDHSIQSGHRDGSSFRGTLCVRVC